MGLPVFAYPAPNLVLDNLHSQLFQLLAQFLDDIADNPAVNFRD